METTTTQTLAMADRKPPRPRRHRSPRFYDIPTVDTPEMLFARMDNGSIQRVRDYGLRYRNIQDPMVRLLEAHLNESEAQLLRIREQQQANSQIHPACGARSYIRSQLRMIALHAQTFLLNVRTYSSFYFHLRHNELKLEFLKRAIRHDSDPIFGAMLQCFDVTEWADAAADQLMGGPPPSFSEAVRNGSAMDHYLPPYDGVYLPRYSDS